jgi:hypothetical protein
MLAEKPNRVERRRLKFTLSLGSGESASSQSVTLAMLHPLTAEKGGAKGEFAFETPSSSMFQIDPKDLGKCPIAPNDRRQVEISFRPPDLSTVLAGLLYSATAVLVVKAAGNVQRYNFELQAYVTN